MVNKRLLRNIDFTLLIAVFLLNAVSMFMISSATHVNISEVGTDAYLQRQLSFFFINLILLFISFRFDYRQLARLAKPLYFFNIIMLLAVMFLGHSSLGAQRWIQIGPISIQPSEFAKVITIIFLAKIINDRKESFTSIWSSVPIFAYLAIPFLLVLKQPDLGTSLVFIAIILAMLYVAGIPTKLYFYLAGAAVVSAPFFWNFLKDYQKQRILVFLNPEKDPYGSGYHIIQSKIAIGSGMFSGKGLFAGTQSQLNFLPENHTDFIFAVIGEELGFLGACFVLALYAIVFYRGIKIAFEAKDDFGSLLAIGVVAMMAFHLLINVGMTTGIMPVTGIPLPFMSYGVSSLTTNMMCIALLLNIHIRRKSLFF